MFSRKTLLISISLAMPFAANAELPDFAPKNTVPVTNMGLSQPATTVANKVESKAKKEVPVQKQSLTKKTEKTTEAATATQAPASNDASAVDTVATDSTKTDAEAPTKPAKTAAKGQSTSWTLAALNDGEWAEDFQAGQYPIYAKLQVLLARNHASPGAIDGSTGKNTLKAISAFQTINGLNATGKLNAETWKKLNAGQNEPAFIEYTITDADLKGPYAASIPSNYAEQAKMKGLYYTRVTEMLGEKFHMDEAFLKKINPNAKFKTAGEKIIVANARNNLPEDIKLIVAHKGAKQLYLFNSQNKMIASFPATIGSSDTPSPSGTHTVKGAAPNPWYSYNPKNFVQGGNMKPLSLPPGPNNPVGSTWIGLSKPSFGIHGTPNPSLISKTASHGCIRLTNWDVQDLAKRVKPGVTVKFLD